VIELRANPPLKSEEPVDRVDVAVDELQHIGPSIFNLDNNH
jgi:hypothetical protein